MIILNYREVKGPRKSLTHTTRLVRAATMAQLLRQGREGLTTRKQYRTGAAVSMLAPGSAMAGRLGLGAWNESHVNEVFDHVLNSHHGL